MNNFIETNSTKSTWLSDVNTLHEATAIILLLNRKRRNFNKLIFLELMLCIFWVLINFFTNISRFWYPSDFYRMLSILFSAMLMVVLREFHNSSKFGLNTYKTVIENLNGLEHLCLLIPLTEGVQAFQPFELAGVEDKIIAILSNITEGDKGILTNKELQYLWHLGCSKSEHSKPFFSSAFSLALLPALAKIGNEAILQNMRELAQQLRLQWDCKEQALCELARQQLPGMEMRLHQQSKSDTLLRPSLPSIISDGLLRPAIGTEQTNSEESAQLLRPLLEHDDAERMKLSNFSVARQPTTQETEQPSHMGITQGQFHSE